MHPEGADGRRFRGPSLRDPKRRLFENAADVTESSLPDSSENGTPPVPAGPGLARRLEREHLRQLYRTTRLGQWSVLAVGAWAVALAALEADARPLLLAAWFLALVVSVLFRLALVRRYETSSVPDGALRFWQRRTQFAFVLSGLVWGLYAWLAPPGREHPFAALAALIAVTITGASLVLVTVNRIYYLSFSLPIFFLLVTRLLVLTPRAPLLALTVTVVFTIFFLAAERSRRTLAEVVLRGERNARLVAALRRQRDLLARERDRQRRLIESIPTPVAYCDHDLVLRRCNQSFTATFVRPDRPLFGKTLPEILGRRRFQAFAECCARARAGTPQELETTLPSLAPKDRKKRVFRISIAPDTGDEGEVGLYLHFVDITDYKATEARLAAAALRDPLTGLYNRRGFETILEWVYEHEPDIVHSVVYLDLDRLKEINDLHGHETGDAVLRAFAARLAAAVRTSDHCARLGGDEFAVLLRNCPPECAQRVAASIRRALGRLFAHDGAILSLNASLGGVSFLPRTTTGRDAVSAADRCMYEAKRTRAAVIRSLL